MKNSKSKTFKFIFSGNSRDYSARAFNKQIAEGKVMRKIRKNYKYAIGVSMLKSYF